MERLFQLFRQEKRGLEEEGRTFSKEYPESASYLDSSSVEDRDPYVERLVEAFCFQTGLIRDELSTNRDEMAELLLEQFAPDVLQPLPSLAVVQFRPTKRRYSIGSIPKGSVVRSKPLKGAKHGVPFQLQDSLEIRTIQVQAAKIIATIENQPELRLTLTRQRWAPGGWPNSLQLFLHADAPIVWALRYALTERVASIDVSIAGRQIPAHLRFQASELSSYTAEAGLASPLVMARDFLTSDERFRFLDLHGLDQLPPRSRHPVDLTIRFSGPLPRSLMRGVVADCFRCDCGIMVNRSLEAVAGIRWDHTVSEVPLRPNGGDHREVLETVRVTGFATEPNIPQRSFHDYRSRRWSSSGGIFHAVSRIDGKGRRRTFLGIADTAIDQPPRDWNLGVEAYCGDGDFPYQNLSGRSLSVARKGIPFGMAANGLTRPTQSFRLLPHQKRSLLLVVTDAHHKGWLDADRLKDGLRHLQWDPAESKRTVVESIQTVKTSIGYEIIQGVTWRVFHVEIVLRDTTCTPDTWDRIGVLQAFGGVLLGFASDQTEIGFKCRLSVRVEPCGVEFHFGEKR